MLNIKHLIKNKNKNKFHIAKPMTIKSMKEAITEKSVKKYHCSVLNIQTCKTFLKIQLSTCRNTPLHFL